MELLFKAESVHAGYGRDIFITGLDLSVSRGEFLSIIGPNGAGKSTILRLLTGILAPVKGRIMFRGGDMTHLGAAELAKNFSVVMRITGDMPAFSVRSFLGLGLFARRGANHGGSARVEETAERTGIRHLMERPVNELSTGEFQLVQAARALVQNSDIIILDEPVSNLDYGHTVIIMDMLKELNSSGTTVLCALHDVNTASNYSSRIVCLKEGCVFLDGHPDAVVKADNMSRLYDTEFISLANPATGSPMVVPVPGRM